MSLEVIEIMILDSLKDGEISSLEKDSIVKQGQSFGISEETILSMIDAGVKKHQDNILKLEKQKEEEELINKKEKLRIEEEANKLATEKIKKQKDYEYRVNFKEWEDDLGEVSFLWGLLYGAIGLIVGIINAYSHNKGWMSYIGMALLGFIYGVIAYGIVIGLSFLQKRKPLLDWQKPFLIGYFTLVLVFISYLLIPNL
jgi:hypothetical protein